MPNRVEDLYGTFRSENDQFKPLENISEEIKILKKAGIRLGESRSEESSKLENGEVKLGTDSKEYPISGPVLGGKT
jgi:hypothetical protein